MLGSRIAAFFALDMHRSQGASTALKQAIVVMEMFETAARLLPWIPRPLWNYVMYYVHYIDSDIDGVNPYSLKRGLAKSIHGSRLPEFRCKVLLFLTELYWLAVGRPRDAPPRAFRGTPDASRRLLAEADSSPCRLHVLARPMGSGPAAQ